MSEGTVEARTPWWLWPQVLCLDAPIVAMAWMAALERSHHLHLQSSFYIGLGLVTWIIYVLDRTADAASGRLREPLSARHAFCLRHQWLLLRLLVPLAFIYVVWLALTDVPQRMLTQGLGLCVAGCVYLAAFSVRRGVLRVVLFIIALIAGLIVVNLMPLPGFLRNVLAGALVFAVISSIRANPAEKVGFIVPKEVIASLLFALGCSAGVHFWTPPEHNSLCPEVTQLWGLALMNLLTIHWAERVHGEHGETHAPVQPGDMPWTAAIVGCALPFHAMQVWMNATDTGERGVALVAVAAAVLLGLVLVLARRLRPQAVHLLADLALVLPLPLLWWATRRAG